MSRFLRRAALAAAAAGGLPSAALWIPSSALPSRAAASSPSAPQDSAPATCHVVGRLVPAALAAAAAGGMSSAAPWSSPAPLAPLRLSASASSPSMRGPSPGTCHLALIRAHPGLCELNAMLTPSSFVIDGTQAFLACALRCTTIYPGALRGVRDTLSARILAARPDGDKHQETRDRIHMALLHAMDGRFEDGLSELARLANDRPGLIAPWILGAALCHVLGQPEEGNRLLRAAGVPDLSRIEHRLTFMEAVMVATLGSAPRAMAASKELVLVTMLEMIEKIMWSVFMEGDLSDRLQVLAFIVFLRRVVARKLRNDDAPATQEGSQGATPPQAT
ncbi:hypothetical protein ACP4OV_010570 [Aristida adscensionis]